jgi:hypothetical protein
VKASILAIAMAVTSSAFGSGFTGESYSADVNKVGLGLTFSGVTGVSLYAGLNQRNFLQAAVGYSSDGSYAITGDFAFGHHNAFSDAPSVTPYWGLGVVWLHDQGDYWSRFSRKNDPSNDYYGARFPLGLNFLVPQSPVQIAAEIAPSLLLTPGTYGFLQGSLSVRLLF